MARVPQRSGRWSLRQVSLEAQVPLGIARAAVKAGHLDAGALTAHDVLVLRVAAMLPALQPLGEIRPANAAREVPHREVVAVDLIRSASHDLPQIATLVVTAESAQLARTMSEVHLATLEAADAGRPYLAIPVGRWSQELTAAVGQEAA